MKAPTKTASAAQIDVNDAVTQLAELNRQLVTVTQFLASGQAAEAFLGLSLMGQVMAQTEFLIRSARARVLEECRVTKK